MQKRKYYDRVKTFDKDRIGIESLRDKKLRVALYARYASKVSEEIASGVEFCLEYIRKEIDSNPNWTFAGTYFDEGMVDPYSCSGNRIQDLLTDCRDGKIDMIYVKAMSRLARNRGSFLSIVDELSRMEPPVGVYFETENLFTLNEDGNICEYVKMMMKFTSNK